MTFYQQQLGLIRDRHLPPEYVNLQIRQSKSFIDRHYSRNIDLNEISKSAFFSKHYFIRLFKQVYGLTPHQYLRAVRIENARKLLKKKFSMSRVCYEVGFESLSTFSGLFKRSTGLSPSAYQLKYKSNFEEMLM